MAQMTELFVRAAARASGGLHRPRAAAVMQRVGAADRRRRQRRSDHRDRHRAARKLIQMSSQKAPPRQEVLDELIDEKLKIQRGQALRHRGPDTEVDQSFAAMAQPDAPDDRPADPDARQVRHQPSTLKRASAPTSSGSSWCAAAISRGCRSATRTCSRPRSTPDGSGRLRLHAAADPVLRAARRATRAAIEARKREAEALRRASGAATRALPSPARCEDVAVRDQVIAAPPTFRPNCARCSTACRSAS